MNFSDMKLKAKLQLRSGVENEFRAFLDSLILDIVANQAITFDELRLLFVGLADTAEVMLSLGRLLDDGRIIKNSNNTYTAIPCDFE